jgi:hypothetical protein
MRYRVGSIGGIGEYVPSYGNEVGSAPKPALHLGRTPKPMMVTRAPGARLPSEARLALVTPPSSRASSLTLVTGGVAGGVVSSPAPVVAASSGGAGVPDGSGGGGADPVAPSVASSFTREATPVPPPIAGLSTLEWAGIVAGVGALAAGVYFLTR